MPRPRNPYLRADWKICLPAPLAAEIDLMLEDPLTRKPKYGARSKLIESLLSEWIERGRSGQPFGPTLETLRS